MLYFGREISNYGVENGYIDYRCLANIVGNMILCNDIMNYEIDYWNIENGFDYDEENEEYYDIYQCYIIDSFGAEFLIEHTNEIVYYNENLNLYVWCITHYGTSWDYVLTDIEIN